MAPSLTEATLELASTAHGTAVLCACIDVSPAKDRKKIVKWFRGNALKIGTHMTGHRVVMRLLDVVDDTVLTRKAIVNEMAEQCYALAQDKYGVRVLLHLLAPRKVQYLGDEDAGLLSRDITNSKKEPEARRRETLNTLRQPLIDMCVQQCSSLLVAEGGAGCWLLLEVMRKWRSETLAATLAELLGAGLDAPESNAMDVEDDEEDKAGGDEEEEEENLALLERFHVQMLTKSLIDLEESQEGGEEEEDSESTFMFTAAFWSAISGRGLEMATKNRTAYVIESLLKGRAVADQVRDKLQGGEAALEESVSAREGGSESILSVIKLMGFSGRKKKTKTQAKAKAKSKASKPAAKPKKSVPKVSKKAKAVEKEEEEEEQPKRSRRSTRTTAGKKKKESEKPVLRRSTRARKGSI